MAASRRVFLGALGATALSAACGTTAKPAARPRTSPGPLSSASRQPASPSAPLGPAREIDAGRRDRPLVALTFHGQGDPALAVALLSAAERTGAQLTIFAVGSWLAANPDLAGRIRSGGHELANHTQRHRPMADMGEAEAYSEFAHCAEVLHRLTGSAGHWARPSGTPHTTPALRAAAGRAGYRVCVGYDVDTLDYTDPGEAVVRRRAQTAQGGSVVSLHLGHAGTVAALPGILADLRGRNLRPVTLTHLLGVP